MKLWHHRASGSLHSVNGIDSMIYTLAKEQALLGHDVAILIDDPADDTALSFATTSGVELIELPPGLSRHYWLASLARQRRPDLVHMHSVFMPEQWTLGEALTRVAIPFVVTPHGGFAPSSLTRSLLKRVKKSVYSSLAERPRVANARGISAITSQEKAEICSFVPGFRGSIVTISNAVDPSALQHVTWSPGDTPKIIYLGRFDVQCKGIDVILDIAQELGEIEFHLYGPDDDRSLATIAEITPSRLKNVFVHRPVFGAEKAAVLADASLYIQMSRWEVFSISIAEAMYVGLPCVLASTMQLAPAFAENGLGLVVEPNPKRAAQLIRRALLNPSQLKQWSENARRFALANFHPTAVATRFLEFYRDCL